MNFFKYIKAVGTGPRLNRDLTKEETIEAISGILEQRCESEQAAAFLLLLRVKLESNEELLGCLEAFEKYIKRVNIPQSIELGFSYDGKTKQPYLFPLYGKVLENFFKKYQDIESFELVISADNPQVAKPKLTVKQIANVVELKSNIHFFDRANYFKELSSLASLRRKLYMRTMFNTVEKLLNPANSKYCITSAFHKPYVEKYTKLFSQKYENMLIIKGSEGMPEIFKDFKYWYKEKDEIIEKSLKLSYFNINYNDFFKNITLEEAKSAIENPSEELMKLAKLNVAILLFAAKRVGTIEKAFEMLD